MSNHQSPRILSQLYSPAQLENYSKYNTKYRKEKSFYVDHRTVREKFFGRRGSATLTNPLNVQVQRRLHKISQQKSMMSQSPRNITTKNAKQTQGDEPKAIVESSLRMFSNISPAKEWLSEAKNGKRSISPQFMPLAQKTPNISKMSQKIGGAKSNLTNARSIGQHSIQMQQEMEQINDEIREKLLKSKKLKPITSAYQRDAPVEPVAKRPYLKQFGHRKMLKSPIKSRYTTPDVTKLEIFNERYNGHQLPLRTPISNNYTINNLYTTQLNNTLNTQFTDFGDSFSKMNEIKTPLLVIQPSKLQEVEVKKQKKQEKIIRKIKYDPFELHSKQESIRLDDFSNFDQTVTDFTDKTISIPFTPINNQCIPELNLTVVQDHLTLKDKLKTPNGPKPSQQFQDDHFPIIMQKPLHQKQKPEHIFKTNLPHLDANHGQEKQKPEKVENLQLPPNNLQGLDQQFNSFSTTRTIEIRNQGENNIDKAHKQQISVIINDK